MIEGRGGGGGGWHGKKRIMDYTANRVRYSCGRITLFFMNWVGDKTTKDLGSFGSQLIQDFRIQIWFWWPHTVLVLFCHYSCCGVDMSVLWYILIILRGYFSVPLSWFRCINSFFSFFFAKWWSSNLFPSNDIPIPQSQLCWGSLKKQYRMHSHHTTLHQPFQIPNQLQVTSKQLKQIPSMVSNPAEPALT